MSKNRFLSFENFLTEMQNGISGGVFIDDTGSPGLINTPQHLHPNRKTWVAVIVPSNQIGEVLNQFPNAIEELQFHTGAQEFHFNEIFGGENEYADTNPSIRVALFEFFAFLFEEYKFPILVQTLDPNILSQIEKSEHSLPNVTQFDFSKHEDIALIFLLNRVKKFYEQNYSGDNAYVFVDEGFLKNGNAISIPGFKPTFRKGLINFSDSKDILPIQLADFAAFGLNRTQLLLGEEKISEGNRKFLEIYSRIADNFINIDKIGININNWPPYI